MNQVILTAGRVCNSNNSNSHYAINPTIVFLPSSILHRHTHNFRIYLLSLDPIFNISKRGGRKGESSNPPPIDVDINFFDWVEGCANFHSSQFNMLRTGEEGYAADGGPGGSVRIRRLHSLRPRSPVVRSFKICPPKRRT